jgi:hypothetical protein
MYHRIVFYAIFAAALVLGFGDRQAVFAAPAAQTEPLPPPTLDDFWEGRAEWIVDIADAGLPVGESDTISRGDGVYWSYLHASNESAGVIDQCGQPVAFPGCLTLWESTDGGQSFDLNVPVCLIPCGQCPCTDEDDHITAQQYPRVFESADGYFLTYEWHARTVVRRSDDGLNWREWAFLTDPGGTWPSAYWPCSDTERIGPHPNIRGEIHDCLVGAPPGVYVEDNTLYIFVGAGSAPGNMRCYRGDPTGDLSALRVCNTDPLFSGAGTYGPVDVFGAEANAYFDFRYVSSADVIRAGDHYYMFYEGVRGPDVLERGRDTQFGLGLARSTGPAIDGPWEKYADNPIIMDMVDNWGIGHADVLIIDGVTYLYSATAQTTRGRYVLVWRTESES